MSKQWQAPPGWPQPPPGWSPWSGWQPDPSWPSPPPGWQWWRSRRWSLRKRFGVGVAIGFPVVLVVAFFGLLLAAQIADDRAGCGSVDPTDAANYSTVSIVNDTTNVVVVTDCVGTECTSDDLPAPR